MCTHPTDSASQKEILKLLRSTDSPRRSRVSDETGRRPVRTRNDGGIDAAIIGHRLMSPYLPPCAKREGRAQSTLRDLFEALGDELIYALASLGGLFGHAAMKLRGNAQ
jgi:hypothetical protein